MKKLMMPVVATFVAIFLTNFACGQALTKEQAEVKDSKALKAAEDALIGQAEAILRAERMTPAELEAEALAAEQDRPPYPEEAEELALQNARSKFVLGGGPSMMNVGIELPPDEPGDPGDTNATSVVYGFKSGGGIPVTKSQFDPLTPYGIRPITNWNTSSQYPWMHTFHNILDPVQGTNAVDAMQSEGVVPMSRYARSYIYAPLTNHYNQFGEPVYHTLSFVYTAHNSVVAQGQGLWLCTSTPTNLGPNTMSLTNLPASEWKRVNKVIQPFTNLTQNVYFVQEQGENQNYPSGYGIVDNGIHWYRYEPDFRGMACYLNETNSVLTVVWDRYEYPTNHWHAEFAPYVDGPWASNTVPYTITSNYASISFLATNDMRFYKLVHH